MLPELTLTLPVTVRHACQDDLRPLEWFGLITPYRAIVDAYFAETTHTPNVFLVAVAHAFPVGQVWVNLLKFGAQQIGEISALRVIPNLQGLGIGSLLIHAAEDAIRQHGFSTAQLNVSRDNPSAKRLYDRLGYVVVGEEDVRWNFTTPDGEFVEVEEHEYVMQKALG